LFRGVLQRPLLWGYEETNAPEGRGIYPEGIMENLLKRTYGSIEVLYAFDTYQFDDYSKYDVVFDVEAKEEHRKNQFPIDCENAFLMGVRFAAGS